MKNLKRMTTLLLALVMALSLTIPGFASGVTEFTDVPAGSWYEGAVKYVSDNKLMDGVGGGQFNPGGDTSRAMLVTILWRYLDRPEVESSQDFADETDISHYAVRAVDWARENDIISGRPGNRFDPKGRATRAEAAAILQNFLALEGAPAPEPTPEPAPSTGSKTLVVYFSATGSTRRVAGHIADALDAGQFELVPTQPYTSADLNWTAEGSRVNREHDDELLRDVKLTANTVADWADYDTVFIGYPIWWDIAAWPVNDFVKNNNFTGKTVIPFCTSSSSGLGQSGELLAQMAGTGDWQTGMRFSSGASREQVTQWTGGLMLP